MNNHKKYMIVLWGLMLLITKISSGQEEGFDYPLDPEVKMGQLENGFTYYLRNHNKPEGRAEFYLMVKAGAINEEPDQNGLAHFCEHMAFNGTRHFPGKEMLEFVESTGIDFRKSANAYTSQNKTVYCVNKVPTARKTVVDSTLLILHDWANYLSFEEEEIDKERGVIHEEWRTTRTAGSRMGEKTDQVLFGGTKYATHTVIGKTEVIDHAPYSRIRDFYNDWYRPDMQAIAVVGAIDVDRVEKKIKEMFAGLPMPENPRHIEPEEVNDNKEPLVTIASDEESRRAQVRIYYKQEPIPPTEGDYYKRQYMHKLYSFMFNARLKELAQQENPPFLFGAGHYGGLHPSKDAYITFASGGNEKIAPMLETLLMENERVERHGFRETELSRAKKKLLGQLESEYKSRNAISSEEYVEQCMAHFMSNKPITTVEFRHKHAQTVIPDISVSEINSMAKEWIRDENMVFIIKGAENNEMKLPTKKDVLATWETIKKEKIQPYVDKTVTKPLMAEEPEPGKILSESKDNELNIIQWTLSNGMRVLIKPTSFNENEVLMRGYSPGGYSCVSPDKYFSARLLTPVINRSGVGEFSHSALNKKLAGKQVKVNPYLELYSEGFTGECEPEDLETMLQLIHLYFTNPRKDESAFQSYLAKMKAQLESKKLIPDESFNDSVDFIMAGHHPAEMPFNETTLKQVKLQDIMSVYDDRFKDAGSFTFMFTGNIDVDQSKNLIEKYLGSLPDHARNESWKNLGIKAPEGNYKRVVCKEMKDPKSTIFVNYSGSYSYNGEENLKMELIERVLDFRLTKTIREEQGGTYGVYVNENHSKIPGEHFNLKIQFTCDPEKAELLKGILYNEVARLYTKGPDTKVLENIKKRMINEREQDLVKNSFWLNTIKLDKVYKNNIREINAFNEIIRGITLKDIRKTAEQRLKKANQAEIILLPRR